MSLRSAARALVVVSLALAGCGGGGTVKSPAPSAQDNLTLTSSAFPDGAVIPKRYTCDGAGTSPPLRWTKPPAGTRSLALTVEDPDAPGGRFVHWTGYGIDAKTTHFNEGAVPTGVSQGENSAGKRGWTGPCPPNGQRHHYIFTIYALRAAPELKAGASPDDVRKVVVKSTIARGRFTGLYKRG